MRELGCDLAQGFLFAKAIPADELREVLVQRASSDGASSSEPPPEARVHRRAATCETCAGMVVEITFDATESGSFDQQHDAFVRELRKQGLVVSAAVRHEDATHHEQVSETTIHLFGDEMTLHDTVADIRRAAGKHLHDTLPNPAAT